MLTEVNTTKYVIKVNGVTIIPNIPSRAIAEATVFGLPPDQRAIAEIVTVTDDGRTMLLG